MSVYCIVNSRQKLHDPTRKIFLNEPLQYDNAQAHCFRLTLTADDGTSPADLSDVSGVVANFMRPDGGTVEIATGTITGNVVEVILPAACYSSVGRYKLTVNLVEGSGESAAARTAMIVEGITERNTSGTPVDPGTIMPSINDLIQEIEDARAEIEPEYTNLVNGVVRHDMVQSLTPEHQVQARNNIRAADEADFDAVAYPLGVEMLTSADEAVRVLSGGINTSGGDLNSGTRARTQYFRVQPGHRYMFSLNNAEFVVMSAWEYNGTSQSTVIGRVSPSGYTTSRFAFTASGKFARIAFGHADTSVTITDEDKAQILAALSLKETASDNLAPVDTSTATATHAAGSLLTVGGQLYKATQAIATGETITPGTNVTETSVADELAERDTAIAAEIAAETTARENQDTLISDTLRRLSLTPFERSLFTLCQRDITVNTSSNHRVADLVYNAIYSEGEDRGGTTFRTVWLTGSDTSVGANITSESLTTIPRDRFSHFVPDASNNKLIVTAHRVTYYDQSFSNASNNPPVFYFLTYDPDTGVIYWKDYPVAVGGHCDVEFGLSQCVAYGNIGIAVLFRRPTQTIDWQFNARLVRPTYSPYTDGIPEQTLVNSGKTIDTDATT